MGWFSRTEKRKIPTFAVSVFGKLPFYKDFLYSSSHAGFAEFKTFADQGYERLIRDGAKPPYVNPDRCFYLRLNEHKISLAGRIWESNDGLRHFPFIAAATMPKGWPKGPLAKAWPCLQAVWDHLGRFGNFLRELDEPRSFYAQIRGQTHKLPVVEIQPPNEDKPDPEFADIYRQLQIGQRLILDGPDWPAARQAALLAHAGTDPLPSYLSVPADSNWADAESVPSGAVIIGFQGLADWQPPEFQSNETVTERSPADSDPAAEETCSGEDNDRDHTATQTMNRDEIQAVLSQAEAMDAPTAKFDLAEEFNAGEQASADPTGGGLSGAEPSEGDPPGEDSWPTATARMELVHLDDQHKPAVDSEGSTLPSAKIADEPSPAEKPTEATSEESDHDR